MRTLEKAQMRRRVDSLRKLFRTVPPPTTSAVRKRARIATADTATSLKTQCANKMIRPKRKESPTATTTEKATNDEEEATIFENAHNPAKVIEKNPKLRWKKGYEPDDVEISAEDLQDLSLCEANMIDKSPDYKTACKILLHVSPEAMASLLTSEENRAIRHLFKKFYRRKPTREIVRLLQRAMAALQVRLVCEGKISEDPEMKTFLLNPKAEAHLMDMILTVPELMPECWGGSDASDAMHADAEEASKVLAQLKSTMAIADNSPVQLYLSPMSPTPINTTVPTMGSTSIWSAHLSQIDRKGQRARSLDEPLSREQVRVRKPIRELEEPSNAGCDHKRTDKDESVEQKADRSQKATRDKKKKAQPRIRSKNETRTAVTEELSTETTFDLAAESIATNRAIKIRRKSRSHSRSKAIPKAAIKNSPTQAKKTGLIPAEQRSRGYSDARATNAKQKGRSAMRPSKLPVEPAGSRVTVPSTTDEAEKKQKVDEEGSVSNGSDHDDSKAEGTSKMPKPEIRAYSDEIAISQAAKTVSGISAAVPPVLGAPVLNFKKGCSAEPVKDAIPQEKVSPNMDQPNLKDCGQLKKIDVNPLIEAAMRRNMIKPAKTVEAEAKGQKTKTDEESTETSSWTESSSNTESQRETMRNPVIKAYSEEVLKQEFEQKRDEKMRALVGISAKTRKDVNLPANAETKNLKQKLKTESPEGKAASSSVLSKKESPLTPNVNKSLTKANYRTDVMKTQEDSDPPENS